MGLLSIFNHQDLEMSGWTLPQLPNISDPVCPIQIQSNDVLTFRDFKSIFVDYAKQAIPKF